MNPTVEDGAADGEEQVLASTWKLPIQCKQDDEKADELDLDECHRGIVFEALLNRKNPSIAALNEERKSATFSGWDPGENDENP